jgi:hypothetical protein
MKKRSSIAKQPKTLESQLDTLKQLKPEELRKRWQALFGSAPPSRIRSSLMVQAIARRLQEKTLGGLKPSTQRVTLQASGRTKRRANRFLLIFAWGYLCAAAEPNLRGRNSTQGHEISWAASGDSRTFSVTEGSGTPSPAYGSRTWKIERFDEESADRQVVR